MSLTFRQRLGGMMREHTLVTIIYGPGEDGGIYGKIAEVEEDFITIQTVGGKAFESIPLSAISSVSWSKKIEEHPDERD